jgi:type II secretory pathway pseudopilin PulG
MCSRRAFSLLQTAIAVMVLAAVATMVVPRFSQAGIAENRMDDLCNNLQLLRSQIELYKVQHSDDPPMRSVDGSIAFDPQFQQMVFCTDTDGNIKSRKPRTKRDDVYLFGPYIEDIPKNPFNGSDTIVRASDRGDIPVP